ncbi:hypothetical protein ACW6QP_04305 [Salegentibacter sp. HM20]
METELLDQVFLKAEKESGKSSLNGRAEHLSELMLLNHKYSISSKSLIRYYQNESSPNKEIRDYLAEYLNYASYEDFVLKNSKSEKPPVYNIPIKNPGKIAIVVTGLILILGVSGYVGYSTGTEDCLLWNGKEYVLTQCSGDNLEKSYNKNLLENFRKVEVTTSTKFFHNDEPVIWYDKSNNQLEFFSAPGIHPENGKTLKPVTKYIIDKYVYNH